jgi:hypothetical protein
MIFKKIDIGQEIHKKGGTEAYLKYRGIDSQKWGYIKKCGIELYVYWYNQYENIKEACDELDMLVDDVKRHIDLDNYANAYKAYMKEK